MTRMEKSHPMSERISIGIICVICVIRVTRGLDPRSQASNSSPRARGARWGGR
jgi:hypothetical protein